jgi:S-adenosyl-L-methionine hydrolase (adenosine-forming)
MSETFNPSGVITVTTDFGHRGPFVGTMKGVIASRYPAARIIDLTHEAYVHWPAEAGFWIARSYHYFPAGSLHLAVVDPGVGTDRSVLLAIGAGHAFLAPDNGLLAEVIEQTGALVRHVDEAVVERHRLPDLSATFHGRDIFAPLAALIASGELAPAACGAQAHDWVPSIVEPAERRGAQVHGVVMTSDHFGNLITNIEGGALAPYARPLVHAGGHAIALGRTYGDVRPGELLALVNSFGVLEIARAEQNAAEFLGIGRGAPIRVGEAGN